MFKKIIHSFIPPEYKKEEEQFRKAKLATGAYFIVACFNINYVLTSLLINYMGGLYSQIPLFVVSVLCLFLYKKRVAPYLVNFIFFTFCFLSRKTRPF